MTPAALRRLLLAFAALLPSTALAHPGHGASSGFLAGFAHPFLGADHLLAMVAVGLWAWGLGGRARWAPPAVFVAAMLAGATLAYAGFSPPLVEPMVAASVLVLGVLLVVGAKQPVAGAALVAVFATFHGAAHALEMPGDNAIGYSAGFALATAMLHGAGLGLGWMFASKREFARLAGVPIALAGSWLLRAPLA